jgi:hypothetical protein
MLPAGILATALFALLAFAPFASAASDPVGGGKTTVTLNGGWTNYLKTFGIKVQKEGSAKLQGKKATFKNTGGSLDPTTGLGEVTLGGGLKFKAGKMSAPVKGLILNTKKKALFAKVGGKKVKFATVAGWSQTRNGFGVNLTVKKLKLTNAAATNLNKKLGFAQGTPKPFLKNKLIGKGASEVQPGTVTVLPGGLMNLATDPTTIGKLKDVGVTIPVTAPTTEPSPGLYAFPIVGGSLAPSGTAGTAQSAGGLQLLQKLPTNPEKTTFIETEITLGNVWADLSAKTLTVEVIAKSTASKDLNLGNLGRSSIADITVTGLVADAATRTISVNASAVLQPISAEVLEGFVKVYQGYLQAGATAQKCAEIAPACENPTVKAEVEAGAKAYSEEETKDDHIVAGAPLGTVAFTAQTQ